MDSSSSWSDSDDDIPLAELARRPTSTNQTPAPQPSTGPSSSATTRKPKRVIQYSDDESDPSSDGSPMDEDANDGNDENGPAVPSSPGAAPNSRHRRLRRKASPSRGQKPLSQPRAKPKRSLKRKKKPSSSSSSDKDDVGGHDSPSESSDSSSVFIASSSEDERVNARRGVRRGVPSKRAAPRKRPPPERPDGWSSSFEDSDDADDGDDDFLSPESPKKKSRKRTAPPKKRAKRGSAKKAKSTNADGPKRARSAYIFFGIDKRPEIRESNPDAALGEVTKLIAEAWREIEPSLKKKYEKMAQEDKLRYERELEACGGKSKSKSRRSKDAGGPKKPLSAYMHFSKMMRPQVLLNEPDIAFGAIGKRIGEMWRNISGEEKKTYEQMAKDDKERFIREGGKSSRSKSSPSKKDGPKKPLGAYMHFSKAMRPRVLEEEPGLAFGPVGKRIGDMWRNLSPKDKKIYEEMARKDKERYVKEGGKKSRSKSTNVSGTKRKRRSSAGSPQGTCVPETTWEEYKKSLANRPAASTKRPKKVKPKEEPKEEPADDADSQGGKGRKKRKKKKKQEPEVEVWEWWNEDNQLPPGWKWATLQHHGVLFAPPYEPHGVKMKYAGKSIALPPDLEEIATFYSRYLETQHVKKPQFRANFFACWREMMEGTVWHERIVDFEKCDFTPIHSYLQEQKELRKNRSKEEKAAEKAAKEKDMEKYGWALVDSHKEKVGNFRVEPPGLFLGRGAHPKTGTIKKRIMPEDITLNIGDEAVIPPCPIPGHKWGGVVHDHKVTWLAYWKENVNGAFKYVFLSAQSKMKGMADMKKYDKARELDKFIDKIRRDYEAGMKHSDAEERQRSTAMWVIDKLALRAGNEKGEDEADTVGCLSLRVEHIKLEEPNTVLFDFLGKDSMRYERSVEVPKVVFNNFKRFCKGKSPGEMIFDKVEPTALNSHFKTLMPGLSAKVFRTYNASKLLQEDLYKDPPGGKASVAEKVLHYNNANYNVAILCNHKRSLPPKHKEQMAKLMAKKKDMEKDLKALRAHQKKLKKGEGKDGKYPSSGKNMPKSEESCKKAIARLKERINNEEFKMKEKELLKTVALGTSKINYLDPRITVKWCREHDVPLEKIFAKTLREKFKWAQEVPLDEYTF